MSKIAASMLAFLRTGEFGPIKLGISRAELQDCLGEPKNWGPAKKAKQNAEIWKYGDVEFYFDDSDTLWMIFADHIENLRGGSAIEIDPWIFHGGLLAAAALDSFSAAAIPYERIHETLDDDTERYRVGAGVELIFADETKSMFCEEGVSPDARPGMTFNGFSYSVSARSVTP